MPPTKQISERDDTEHERVSQCRHFEYELTVEDSAMLDSVIEWATIYDQIVTSQLSIHQAHQKFDKACGKKRQCSHG